MRENGGRCWRERETTNGDTLACGGGNSGGDGGDGVIYFYWGGGGGKFIVVVHFLSPPNDYKCRTKVSNDQRRIRKLFVTNRVN